MTLECLNNQEQGKIPEEKKSIREAVFFMHNINDCIETIVKQVKNNTFKNNLFMKVVYPLRRFLEEWDEWHDLEKGYNVLLKEKIKN